MADEIDTKNVSVSHYHKDEESIQKLKDLLSDDYCIPYGIYRSCGSDAIRCKF